jgi:hypothetical protein
MNQPDHRTSRTRGLIALALGVLAVYAVFAVGDARSADRRLSQARADLAEITQKLADIERLRMAPKVAALKGESPAEIANRISAAREMAGLPLASLMKEQPREPVRIDRSDFELRATDIELSAATLPQIVTFCDALRDPQTGTVVRDLTLTQPRDGAVGGNQEKWAGQLVLTQMIFSPTSR